MRVGQPVTTMLSRRKTMVLGLALLVSFQFSTPGRKLGACMQSSERSEIFLSLVSREQFSMVLPEHTIPASLWLNRTNEVPSSNISSLGSSWFQYENICVDGSDGIHYIPSASTEPEFRAHNSSLSTIQFFPLNDLIKVMNVTILRGRIALVHCYGITRFDRVSPSHFMFGYGTLFSGIIAAKVPIHLDYVVLHQCPEPFELGEFYMAVWNATMKLGLEREVFSISTKFVTTMHRSPFFCMQTAIAHTPPDRPYQLGRNVVDRRSFQQILTSLLNKQSEVSVLQKREFNRQVRIAIMIRSGDKPSRARRFVNMNAVEDLVRRYDANFEVVTFNSSSSLQFVFDTMNSFDIFITPHGSHIVNILFAKPIHRMAVIEVIVTTCINDDFAWWVEEDGNIAYLRSGGHSPMSTELRADAEKCWKSEKLRSSANCTPTSQCTGKEAYRLQNSDLAVDIFLLQQTLDVAVNHIRKRT